MTPEELASTIATCLRDAVAAGEIPLPIEAVPDAVRVERPRNREHGDWSTNVALQLGKAAGCNPRELGSALAVRLMQTPGLSRVDVAGPGFLNITLDAASAGEVVRTIVTAGSAYGRGTALEGKMVNLEFVSANPTGPIHLGGTRWAAVGDALARVLEAAGASVVREYYFNDHGVQIDRFARSLLAAARGEDAPEDGYSGAYIADVAAAIVARVPDVLERDEVAAQEVFRSLGVDMMFIQVKESLHHFGVDFDVYFHEDSLHKNGAVDRAIARLTQLGRTEKRDGALWLKTTEFGDDKDRVLIKSDGETAYLAGDVAYYLDKRERGADIEIILLGADHHGYVARMMATCAAFGDTPGENLVILIGQMVNLVKDGAPVRMSKRAGTVVVMEDLIDAVGVDAARYQISRYSIDSTIDIDLDLLAQRSNDNPVFYVQYAHARTCNVARLAEGDGVRRDDAFAPELLGHESESALLAILGDYPRVLAQAAELREPHRIARYLEDLAGRYHKWYDECRVRPRADVAGAPEQITDLHRTRLWLNDATGQVLANGLGLLGVSAPEQL